MVPGSMSLRMTISNSHLLLHKQEDQNCSEVNCDIDNFEEPYNRVTDSSLI
jgi:hypothetical protein